MSRAERINWRMPRPALLQPVRWSAGTKLGMLALRGYLVVGAALLVVKGVHSSVAPEMISDSGG